MSVFDPKFSADDYQVAAKTKGFDGFFKVFVYQLKHKLFSGGWSRRIEREVFARGEACAAVLYDPQNHTVGLVEQFRVGAIESEYGPWCLEVVAGMVETGESPEQVVRREIEEEAGIGDVKLQLISRYFSTPGGCSEKIHLYCAVCDLSAAGGVHGLDAENEDIYLHVFPAEQVFAHMLNSRMNNAATLIGLQWLSTHYRDL